MNARTNSDWLQLSAGILTWAAVTGIALYAARPDLAAVSALGALAVVNLASMLVATREGKDHEMLSVAALWLQLLSALLMGWVYPLSFLPIYTIVWITIATHYYAFYWCGVLTICITLAWYGLFSYSDQVSSPMIGAVLFATFHLFAMLTAKNAKDANEARDEVEALNRELLATQELLAETSRQGERTRIARNLHDLLGHHLTALSINLQIAERLSSGDGKVKVAESRALTRLLLSDVRDAVSTLRDQGSVDLAQAVSRLTRHSPGLDVQIDIADDIAIDNVDVAHALLRCVQEGITNSMRHARANRLQVRIWQQDDALRLDMHDDGHVPADLAEGNGLRGMRERLASLDGTLRLNTANGVLHLQATIPLAG